MSETYNASLAVQGAVQGVVQGMAPLNVIECTRKIITKRSYKHVHRATFIQSQSILDSDGNYTEYYYLGELFLHRLIPIMLILILSMYIVIRSIHILFLVVLNLNFISLTVGAIGPIGVGRMEIIPKWNGVNPVLDHLI